jgi:hypothetical protein
MQCHQLSGDLSIRSIRYSIPICTIATPLNSRNLLNAEFALPKGSIQLTLQSQRAP